MSFIFLATVGQFLNAVVAFLDKYIVTDEKVMPEPFVYAFYSCLLTGSWALVFFLGSIPNISEYGVPAFSNIEKPSIQVVGMSFLAAYTFFMALVSMFEALRRAEAVNVMPVIGAVSALSTFGMSYLFLDTTLSITHMWGIVILAIGTLLVSQAIPNRNIILNLVHSGVFFGLHYISMKGLFMQTSFDDGFFWSRVGFVLFALSLLMFPLYYDRVTKQTKETTKRSVVIVISTKVIAGIAAFLILKATDAGDVAVVQALDGLKFVFILFITIAFGSLLPDSIAKHEPRPQEVVRRVLYVAVITVGYFILFM